MHKTRGHNVYRVAVGEYRKCVVLNVCGVCTSVVPLPRWGEVHVGKGACPYMTLQ